MSEDEGAARTMRGAKTAMKRAAKENRILIVDELFDWLVVVGVLGEVRVARVLRGGRKNERGEVEFGEDEG
jgi:hypothetical protein